MTIKGDLQVAQKIRFFISYHNLWLRLVTLKQSIININYIHCFSKDCTFT